MLVPSVCVRVFACPPFCPDAKYVLCASSAGFAYTKFPPAEVMSPSERRLLWFCDNKTPLFNGIAMRRGREKKSLQFVFCAYYFLTLFCHVPKTVPIHSSPLPSLWSQLSPSIPFSMVHPRSIQPLSLKLPLLPFQFQRYSFCSMI